MDAGMRPRQIRKSITKKENWPLQIKRVGCILDEFEMMFQPNRRLTRLLLSTLLLQENRV